MNILDFEVREVLKVERLNNTMKDLEWLKEEVNAYTVSYMDWDNKIKTDDSIWIKVSEDEGQVKKGYVFYR